MKEASRSFTVEAHTRNTLLGEDDIRLELDDLVAHSLDLLLLEQENFVPVLLPCNLDIRLRFSLLVL